jgi:iron complex outermembrane receptor protein
MDSLSTKYLHILALFIALPVLLYSQTDSIGPYEYNLIELSKLKVLSASKVPQEVRNVPANIHIITREEIRVNGYFTLEDALAGLPGFQFRNILGFNSYIFQRGIPNQNNLIMILIDGVSVNELNSGGFYGGGQYNLDNIERIEVIYGPVSSIYGTNAVSGIINIVTRTDEGLNASLLTGSFNTVSANLSYGYKKNAFGLRFSGLYKTSEKADLNCAECDSNWTEEMENFETDYSFDTKIMYGSFTAGFNFMNKRSSRTTNEPSRGTIYQDHGSLWNIAFTNAYLEHKYDILDNLSISTKLYNRNSTVRDNTIARIVDTAQVGYYRPNHLIGLESIVNYIYRDKLEITTGIIYETEHIAESFSKTFSSSKEDAPPKPPKPDMLHNYLLSVFLQSEYRIIEKLSFIGSLRYDYSSIYDHVLTPRTSLILNTEALCAKLLYTEAFRAPKPWDYTWGSGNPELLPERMESVQLSNTLYHSDRFFTSISIYRNMLDDAISKEVSETGSRWINKGKFTTLGAEFSAQYSINRVSMNGNYTYNYSYDENRDILPEIAKHTLNGAFSWRLNRHLGINLQANYLGKRKNPQTISATNSEYVDPVLIFHGTISLLDYHNADIQIITRNIFNSEYYHTSNTPIERYRQPQRTVLLKLTYNFIRK